jgi:hypothetical protein
MTVVKAADLPPTVAECMATTIAVAAFIVGTNVGRRER